MMSNDALILDLAADLRPVRRRSASRDAVLLIGLAAMELAFVLGMGAMRPDMGQAIQSAYMMWKMGSLAVLAAIACAIAIRSFSPPAMPRRGLRIVAGLAALAMAGGALVVSAADSGRPLLERLSPGHGMICAVAIVTLALPLMAMLAILMRRAAPVHPGESAVASGLAAATCGALIFAFCCPANDPLYIIVWYSVGCGIVTLTARWLLPRRFRL